MNTVKREFGAMKWIFVTALTAVLIGIVGYFNLRIFGFEDGLPYVFAVVCIGGGAICIAHYVSSRNKVLARAAFVFDVLLYSVLIFSAAYSISGLREMGLAKQVNADQNEAIKGIGGLRSRRAQSEGMEMVAAKYSQSQDVQAVFARYERPLFYLLVIELAMFGLAMFTMIGIAFLPDRNDDGTPDLLQSKAELGSFSEAKTSDEFEFNGSEETQVPKARR